MSDIALSAETIVARVERLPISRWHNYMRVVVGSATFFDAFDALVIAFVLPVLIPLWQMSPAQVGLLVSSGYVGQVIGCILFGWVAERFGRLRSLAWTIGVISVLSIACAFAWDATSLSHPAQPRVAAGSRHEHNNCCHRESSPSSRN